MAPAATPKPIVAKVAEAIAAVLQLPDVKARFEPQGVELKSSPPDTFDAVIRSDADRYGQIIKPPGELCEGVRYRLAHGWAKGSDPSPSQQVRGQA
jgi:tripartite-type tricarboxylate transporter receptor subunit TctC